jgi:hypothetical protein
MELHYCHPGEISFPNLAQWRKGILQAPESALRPIGRKRRPVGRRL